MTFDVLSIYLAASVICVISVLALIVIWATNREVPGLHCWMLSTLVFTFALPLFMLQERWENRWLTFVLPTIMTQFSIIAQYVGVCRFIGKTPRSVMIFGPTAVALAGYLFFMFVSDSLAMRIRIMSAVTFLYFLSCGWMLLQEKRTGLLIGARILGGGFLLASCLMMFRFISWIGENRPSSWVTGADGNSAGIALSLPSLMVVWMFCIMLLVNQWQTRQLSLRMASEIETSKQLAEARIEIERQRAQQLKQTMVRELHDGIGGITATVAMLAGSGKAGNANFGQEAFGLIEEMALEGNRNVRSLMDYLDSGVFQWCGMLDELEDYVRKLAMATGVALEWKVRGKPDSKSLPDGMAGNSLRMVIMEAIHNLVRHSGAKSGSVLFDFSEESLDVEISDDGSGFKAERQGGRGVGNMRMRMEEAGGTFSIEGGKGTRVKLSLPMRRLDKSAK